MVKLVIALWTAAYLVAPVAPFVIHGIDEKNFARCYSLPKIRRRPHPKIIASTNNEDRDVEPPTNVSSSTTVTQLADGTTITDKYLEDNSVVDSNAPAFGSNDERGIVLFLGFLVSRKEDLYASIRQVFSAIVTIIKRSTEKTNAWVRDDAMGQLISSSLALLVFFAAVAAFAAWNIQVLGGKKWSGPTEVTVPVVRVSNSPSSKIQFQKPKWKAPRITSSYGNVLVESTESSVVGVEMEVLK
mmetsp:Transcript_37743/g.76347  ORF Transcript_37743/g.76347 Transcript_37743/m.76347 type:complete len:243 (+) Transcript_37743:116-844(+)